MRLLRAASAAAALIGLISLAACGGGGGGTNPPVTTPSTSAPGGPPPATSSPKPTSSPGGSTPSPKPTSSAAPKPTPTSSSVPVPTPTASNPPSPGPTASAAPTPGATSTPPPSQTTDHAGDGTINGTDNQILSSAPNTHNNKGEGDLESGDPGALPQGGGQGSPVDNIPTSTSMSDNYHVHAFLGLIVNGQQVAIPDGIGMVNPYGDFQETNPNAPSYSTCIGAAYNNFECYADAFYYMHTHDASGAIHMEAPSPVCGPATNYTVPCDKSVFTLGNFLDIWGISTSANNFGPFNGPVSVYTSPLGKANSCSTSQCYTPSNTYSQYTGDLRSIALYSHTVVWVVVGSPQPARPADLPNVEWFLTR